MVLLWHQSEEPFSVPRGTFMFPCVALWGLSIRSGNSSYTLFTHCDHDVMRGQTHTHTHTETHTHSCFADTQSTSKRILPQHGDTPASKHINLWKHGRGIWMKVNSRWIIMDYVEWNQSFHSSWTAARHYYESTVNLELRVKAYFMTLRPLGAFFAYVVWREHVSSNIHSVAESINNTQPPTSIPTIIPAVTWPQIYVEVLIITTSLLLLLIISLIINY